MFFFWSLYTGVATPEFISYDNAERRAPEIQTNPFAMTTKPPSFIKAAPDSSLERIAYASVANIPTMEPHDQDRLGYNIWRWLAYKRDSLEFAVETAGVRLLISEEEALQRIRENLRQHNMDT